MSGLEPFLLSLGASASTASTVGSIGSFIGTIGTGLSALGTLKQANAQASASEYNAKVAERNAEIAQQQGKAEEDAAKRENRLRLGSNIAQASASGRGMAAFSDVLQDNAAQEELDILTIRQNTALRKAGLLSTATLDRASASSARSAGYMGAGTKILTSFSGFN